MAGQTLLPNNQECLQASRRIVSQRREMACLRAPNDRIDEHILGFGLRDLAAEIGWVAPKSVS